MCFHRLKKNIILELCFALNKLYMYMVYSDPRIIWGVRPRSYEKVSAQIFSLYEIKGAYVHGHAFLLSNDMLFF